MIEDTQSLTGVIYDESLDGVVAMNDRYIPDEIVTEDEFKKYMSEHETKITEQLNQQTADVNIQLENQNREFDERLDEYSENYLDIITPKNTASGQLVQIRDALGLHTFGTKTAGQVRQVTTTGKQLFDYEDITKQVANEFITDDEGWITLSCDNSAGTEAKFFNYFTNNLALENSKNYNVIVEVKKVTGEGRLSVTNTHKDSQFNYEYPLEFIGLKNGSVLSKIVPTKDSFEGTLYGLRTYISFSTGRSGSITFRISVLEDTTVNPETFVYEPYTGGQASPNPEFPQEVEVLEGYNLLKVDTVKSSYKGLVFTPIYKEKENGFLDYINVDGTATEDAYLRVHTVERYDVDKQKTYTISGCPSGGSQTTYSMLVYYYDENNTYLGGTYDIGSGKEIPKASKINVNIMVKSGITMDNVKFYPMLVEGTEKKPYVPYGAIGYKVNGKNFLNPNKPTITLNGITLTNNGDGTYTVSGTSTKSTGFPLTTSNIILEKGKTYTQSVIVTSGTQMGTIVPSFKNSAGEIKFNFFTNNATKTPTDVMTLYSYDYYIAEGTTANFTFKVQLEKSSTATDYEPYQEQIVPLDLKGNEVVEGDNLIIDKKNNVSLVKNWIKADLNDSNVGKVITEYNGNYWIQVGKPTNSKMYSSFSRYKLLVNCAYYSENNKERFSYQTGVGGQFWGIIVNSTDTIEDIRPKILGGYYYYELATPEIIELGELPEPIKTFEGVNNIQLLANLDTEIEVVYALDIKKYTDNKLAEISAQII